MINKTKKYKIPSKSEKGTFRYVTVWPSGQIECDCPALDNIECRHKRIYRRWAGEIKGNPEKCFYTGDPRHLEEHHLYRGPDRRISLSVYLTHWIHERATLDKEFEEHITKLFFKRKQMDKLYTQAIIKEVSIKNLESGDKGLRVELKSEDVTNALKLGVLTADQLVKVELPEEPDKKFYALVKSTNKKNYAKKDPVVDILLDVAPGEILNAYVFGILDPETKVNIKYKKVNNNK